MHLKKISLYAIMFTAALHVLGGTTGKISGSVKDLDTGEALIGADVFLVEKLEGGSSTPLSLSNRFGAATDVDGDYYIINIPPGIYTVEFNYIGYQRTQRSDVRVTVDMTTTLDVNLSTTMLEAGETVVVTANRSLVKKDLTSSQVSIGADQIDAMPVRSVEDLVKLQAGVVEDAAGNIHIRGGRSSEVTYMVDGVQVIDPLNRSKGISIDDQAIEELKTITGTFNAEYGQALSGVVNIVTKQGSEKFSYSLTGYFGDYFSLDDGVYSLMGNDQWGRGIGKAFTGDSEDLQQYLDGELRAYYIANGVDTTSWSDINESTSQYYKEKPYLKKEGYLASFNPIQATDLQINFSGPITKRMTYFVSARQNKNPGYRYGIRYFMPWGADSASYVSPSDGIVTLDAPDGEIVALNTYTGYNLVGKLYLELSSSLRLSYGVYYNNDHSYSKGGYANKYRPDGGRHFLTESSTQILGLKQTISPSMFYDLKFSKYSKVHHNYLYEDADDERYMPTNSSDIGELLFSAANQSDRGFFPIVQDFNYWGNETSRSYQDISYSSINFDLTNQLNKTHLVKLGFTGRWNDLLNDYVQLQFDDIDYRPFVPSENSPYHVNYQAKPKEFAFYIQDKVEFDELIINLGLRWDYFDPDGKILADPMDPQIYDPFKLDHIYSNYSSEVADSDLVEYSIAERELFWWKDASPKTQVSPRLGISFPITDRGVIHFSYGHFFQNPAMSYLYNNPNFWIEGAGATNLVGNADLDAERSIMYEIGLQQELSENIYLHVTGFYRDIRGWIGTGTPIDTYQGKTYYKYENKDHAAAQGVTISNTYRFGQLNMNLDYTFMTAKGTSSDPRDAYNAAQGDQEPTLQLINLDWDQQQTFNATISHYYKGWSNTIVSSLASGLPYTPTFSRGEVSGSGTFVGLRTNSSRKPLTFNVDYRLSKSIELSGFDCSVFLNVQNLLDYRNALNVYTDTGRADYTLEGVGRKSRYEEISDIDEYYSNPGNYSAPRFIQLGVRISG